MHLTALTLAGTSLLRFAPHRDTRGHFVRLWDRQLLAEVGLPGDVLQMSSAFNARKGTVRGLHFGWPPSREAKFVRCTRGRVFDVLVDLRPRSATYLQTHALELSADDPATLIVPPGVAHGYQTLDDDCELHYAMNEAYRADCLGVLPFDDPQWRIEWPLPVTSVSARDRDATRFDARQHRDRWLANEVDHALD